MLVSIFPERSAWVLMHTSRTHSKMSFSQQSGPIARLWSTKWRAINFDQHLTLLSYPLFYCAFVVFCCQLSTFPIINAIHPCVYVCQYVCMYNLYVYVYLKSSTCVFSSVISSILFHFFMTMSTYVV